MNIAFGVFLVPALVTLSGCSYFDPPLLRACEEVLLERLRSPSLYKRIKYSERQEDLSIDAWVAIERSQAGSVDSVIKADEQDLRKENRSPSRYVGLLTYDAPNSYGTPIRSTALCEHTTPSEKNDVTRHSVVVDGKTSLEWMTDALKQDH